jgi:outer membrane protein assembly factor BamD (BamD/ComL family)
VLEDERRQSRLEELEAQLASIPDPLEEIRKQVDKTAFILVYQADRLYRELNETESAVETYNRVIRLFPRNQWAAVARERLSEIEGRRI